jgi:hypothetical protein
VSEISFTVRFDGPIFEGGHKMAVEDFAPSLLALSALIKRANELLNGDRTRVRVLIDVDVEQHCFQFDLQIIQSIWEQAKDLFGEEHIKSATDLAKSIGVVATSAGAVIGLIAAVKKLRGRAPADTKMVVRDGSSVVQINAGGDVFYVTPETHKLLADAETIDATKKTIKPVAQPGYETIEFKEGDRPSETIGNEEARLIQGMPTPPRPDETTIPASTIRATVTVRRAVYIGTGKWTIQYDKAREMTVADEDWLAKFQANKIAAPPGSQLDVSIRVSAIKVDPRGEPVEPPDYTIVKVHGVIQP